MWAESCQHQVSDISRHDTREYGIVCLEKAYQKLHLEGSRGGQGEEKECFSIRTLLYHVRDGSGIDSLNVF